MGEPTTWKPPAAGVEHDVVDARLEVLGGELPGALDDHVAPPRRAATPPIWVDFEP